MPPCNLPSTRHSHEERSASLSIARTSNACRSPGRRCGVKSGEIISTSGGRLTGGAAGGSTSTSHDTESDAPSESR